MLKVNLIAVGKVKEKYFADGISEYVKRLSRFCEFNLIEVQEENYSKVDDAIISIIKQKEGERILPHLKGSIYSMAIEGKKYTSESFSSLIKGLSDRGVSAITFVIGGSYGLSDEVKKKSNGLISFSDMTFPHTLFRLLCTEQLYRAFSIISGSNYHK